MVRLTLVALVLRLWHMSYPDLDILMSPKATFPPMGVSLSEFDKRCIIHAV